jgi:hypothetical protein
MCGTNHADPVTRKARGRADSALEQAARFPIELPWRGAMLKDE